ncbi:MULTISPECIES: DUF3558 domain-containing protein [unclassified Amycolatopsis]|uniref:DUF3558 domain-containing protein n=1 Tax=unclassified Amycolatopsis TaxID=2618356 RepID=UPI00106E61A3|nr:MULTISPECIES: DUF3558 domain-containing protein [unclassified Amycolatopsis]
MKEIRAVKAALLIGAAALVLTACDNTVNGAAQTNGTTSAAPPSSSASSGNPFSERKQCALLDQILNGEGFPKAAPSLAQGRKACAADKASGGANATAVALALQEGQRYADGIGSPDKARSGKISGRPFIEEPEPMGSSGQCSISMSVESSSRALIIVTGGVDTSASCGMAEKLATKLDPLLPKG